MSRTTNRDSSPREGRPVDHRLTRLLDTPLLAHVVPRLPPEALHQLVRSRGLDACVELVASATPAQLSALLDLDLWRQGEPGRDPQFDGDRFGEWLDVLVDAGPEVAARMVAALDTDLMVAGLCRYVRVFDPGIFEPTAQSDDEPMDRHDAMREGDSTGLDHAARRDRSGPGLECDVGGYIVRARRVDAWDAIVTLLVALDTEDHRAFHAIMQGCRRVSNSRPEIDGLDQLLMAPEQHQHDVAVARERRQSQQGYAIPADARALLQMARQPRSTRPEAATTDSMAVSPIVTAYFRAAEEAPEPPNEPARSPERGWDAPASISELPAASHRSDAHAPAAEVPESIDAVIELLTEAGVVKRPRALLEGAAAGPARLTSMRRLMAHVRDTDETADLMRTRELAFLANTLLAGCSVQSRPFTPEEASAAAASICNLGLEHWPARWPGDTPLDSPSPHPRATAAARLHDTSPPDAFLIRHDLVTAFEVGWSVLHHDVSLFVADQLISTLADLQCDDRDIRHGLVALRRALVQHRDAGTPWLARGRADVLAMLDQTAWTSVLGLLDECPVVPAALPAVVEGRTTAVSPTEFAFISTTAQIDEIRIFMRMLPDVLSR